MSLSCLTDPSLLLSFSATDNFLKRISYYVSETATDWYSARARCKQLGGDLFYIDEHETFQDIKEKLSHSSRKKMYIGLMHRIWKLDGELFYYLQQKT